jgi:hypothetical protein
VYLGFNGVATNTPEKGEHLTTVEEFSAGNPVKIQHTNANPVAVSLNAKRILSTPKKYNLLSRNCEHTAHEVVHGIPRSPTVVVLWILALGCLLWILLLRR